MMKTLGSLTLALLLVAGGSSPLFADAASQQRINDQINIFCRKIAFKEGKIVFTGSATDLHKLANTTLQVVNKGTDPVVKGTTNVEIAGGPKIVVRYTIGKSGNAEEHPNGYDAVCAGDGITIAIGGDGAGAVAANGAGGGGSATASGGALNVAIGGTGGTGYKTSAAGKGGRATANCAKGQWGVALGGDGGYGFDSLGEGGPAADAGDATVAGDGQAQGGDGGRGGNGRGGPGGAGSNGGKAAVSGAGTAVGGPGGDGGSSVLEGGTITALVGAPGGAGGTATGGKGCKTTPGADGKEGKVDVR